jgi:hypothetical protein
MDFWHKYDTWRARVREQFLTDHPEYGRLRIEVTENGEV